LKGESWKLKVDGISIGLWALSFQLWAGACCKHAIDLW